MKKFKVEATLTDFKPYLSINSHEDKENQEKIDKVKNQFDKLKKLKIRAFLVRIKESSCILHIMTFTTIKNYNVIYNQFFAYYKIE